MTSSILPLGTIISLPVLGVEPLKAFLLFFPPLIIVVVFGIAVKILFESVMLIIFIINAFDVGA